MSNADLRWLSLASAVAFALPGCGVPEEAAQDIDSDTDYPYSLDAGLRCDGGVDVLQAAPGGGQMPTGVEWCPDGSKHRYAAVPCTLVAEGESNCDTCVECHPPAFCRSAEWGGCYCFKPCKVDDDCAPDEACLCRTGNQNGAYCVAAWCRMDTDCGDLECGLSDANCDAERLACRTADDECHGDAQCASGALPECGFAEGASYWGCLEWEECE